MGFCRSRLVLLEFAEFADVTELAGGTSFVVNPIGHSKLCTDAGVSGLEDVLEVDRKTRLLELLVGDGCLPLHICRTLGGLLANSGSLLDHQSFTLLGNGV